MVRPFARPVRAAAIAVAVALIAVTGTDVSTSTAAGVEWEFVYGDPGPANYSRYQAVRSGSGGEAYLAGFFSGTFHGLTATDVYRPFVQRIDADGTIAWTVVPSTTTFTSLPGTPSLLRDGLGNLYFRSDGGGQGIVSLSPAGTILATAASLTADAAAGRPIAVSTGGILQVPFNNHERVERRDATLAPMWSFDHTSYFDIETPPDLAEAPDGSFWLVGTKRRTLPTQSDSVSMVHLSATGQLISSIRHFGVVLNANPPALPDNPILTVGPDYLWVNLFESQSTTPLPSTRAIWSFATDDGRKLGVVTPMLPREQIPNGASMLECRNLGLTSTFENDITPGIAARQVVLGGTRLVALANCGPFVPGVNEDAPVSAGSGLTKVLLTYAAEGPLAANLRRTSTRIVAPGVTISAIDADAQGNLVVAGSTTQGVVFSGPVESNTRVETTAQERAVAIRNPSGNVLDLPDFRPVSPVRLFDTRPGEPNGAIVVPKQRVAPPEPLRIRVAGTGGVPAGGVAAVSLNVTVIDPTGAGFVTVYPCGGRPGASNLNFDVGQTVPNAVIAPVSAAGEICLYSNVPAHLLADVNGWFATGSSFTSLTPARLLDTRPGEAAGAIDVPKVTIGGASELRVRVAGVAGIPPTGAGAVSLNVTITQPQGPGFATVYPCGTRPGASNLNFVSGQTVPNAVITPISPSGEICIFSNVSTHVLADVNGWFGAASGFTGVTPSRLFDTRPEEAQGTVTVPKAVFGGVVELRLKVTGVSGVPASDVSAVSLNVTATQPTGAGFLTVYPCGTRPGASNLNFVSGQTVPNAVIAPVSSTGHICIYSNVDTHVLADVNGWISR